MIVATIIDDGRPQYLRLAVASLEQNTSLIEKYVLIEDAASPHYTDELLGEYKHFDMQVHHKERLGLSGALRSAWETALNMGADFILSWEGDFVAQCEVPLLDMTALLDANPTLSQVCLYRQPVNAEEVATGGYMGVPGRYVQCDGYVKSTFLYSFNPHLVPADVAKLVLSECDSMLERDVTDVLLDFNFHFGVYGNLTDEPRVLHIGNSRSQGWSV